MALGPLEGLRVIDLTDDSGRFATSCSQSPALQ
jgi:hypothetical protein